MYVGKGKGGKGGEGKGRGRCYEGAHSYVDDILEVEFKVNHASTFSKGV